MKAEDAAAGGGSPADPNMTNTRERFHGTIPEPPPRHHHHQPVPHHHLEKPPQPHNIVVGVSPKYHAPHVEDGGGPKYESQYMQKEYRDKDEIYRPNKKPAGAAPSGV